MLYLPLFPYLLSDILSTLLYALSDIQLCQDISLTPLGPRSAALAGALIFWSIYSELDVPSNLPDVRHYF